MAKHELTDKQRWKINKVMSEVEKILVARIQKRKGVLHTNRHETFGKVTEEYFEYATEVQKQNKKKQKAELYDIVDACLMGVISL